MQAVIWQGPRQMTVEDISVPRPGDGEILVKVHSVGICGSEISGFLGENSLRVPPLIMGHEFAGTVAERGPGSDHLREGDAVVVNPLITCGRCYFCQHGHENLCVSRKLIGVHTPGAFAAYVVVPETNCIPVASGDASLALSSLAEPLACGVRAVRVGRVEPGSRVLVLGAGTIGLFSMLAVQEAGGQVVLLSETNPGRLALAANWGALWTCNPLEADVVALARQKTDGLGVDVAIDAVGSASTRQAAIQAVRPGGKVVWIGLHTAETVVPANQMVRSEIGIRGSFAYTPVDFQQAVNILAAGKVEPHGTWLDERPLAACESSFVQLVDEQPAVAKIILHP